MFEGCEKLETVIIGENVLYIYDSAFENSGVSSIIIPNKVQWICGNAFSGCKKLANITMGSGLTLIADYAFYDCDHLEFVNIVDIGKWCQIDIRSIYSSPLNYAKHIK